MQTDGSVAEILKGLDEAGVAGNTLVIFTADNGCSPQADTDALERQGHFASAQFRGYKSDIWEGGHRVPFIVRWPGKVKAGAVTPALVSLNDLMATFAELAEIRLTENVAEDSVSFLDVLLGRTETGRDSLVHHSISGKFAVRQGPWKLALTSGSGGWSKDVEEGPLQLYNLAEDQGETTNLAARQPAKVAELKQLLASIVDRGRSTPGPDLRNDAPVQWRESN
jgi:arylsulfatase A-like enzyme